MFFLRKLLNKYTKKRGNKISNLIKIVEESDFFDKDYYLEQVPFLSSSESFAQHYIEEGWKQHLNPSEKFSTIAYLMMHPDVEKCNVCPLVHYLLHGFHEGRSIMSHSEYCESRIMNEDIDRLKSQSGKKILLVSHEMSRTGAPRALLNMAMILKKDGEYPMFVSSKPGPFIQEVTDSGIPYKTITPSYFDKKVLRSNEEHLFKEFLSSFDVIMLNTIVAMPYIEHMQNISTPIYLWIHDGAMGLHYFPYKENMFDYSKKYDRIFVVGEYCKSLMQPLMDKDKECESLLYGIEEPTACIASDVHSCVFGDSNNNKIKMICAGTIEPRKGQDVLAKSLEELPDEIIDVLDIKLAGQAIDEKIGELFTKGKAVRCVKILGSIKHEELLEAMRQMDILLCPSLDDPMPIVCTEAFMLSKPAIVGTNTGTAAFIENGVNGYVVESGNVKSLTNAICEVYKKRQEIPEMGKRARTIYDKNFSMELFEKKIKEVFEI